MYSIVAILSAEERSQICLDDERSTFLDQLHKVDDLARGYCVFEGLADVIRDLRSLTEEEQGDDDDDDDEEDDEEDLEGLEGDMEE